jgi:predicted O-methyltransferase YrrM
MYLATASADVEVATFEGSLELATIAEKLFRDHDLRNIAVIKGNIDETLEPYLSAINTLDFALIDANHRLEPTLKYLELLTKKINAHSVIAIDDIHNSEPMESAWQTIQAHPLVHTTVDLYRCGLVFFDPSLTKQNVVLQF